MTVRYQAALYADLVATIMIFIGKATPELFVCTLIKHKGFKGTPFVQKAKVRGCEYAGNFPG
ncbi:hypothetical protein CWB99_19080 [Pseudoalteromonas rubra]|uniref:Uncharacterized protein n=1 Tax=Pseudoalteromonas rubra TaxID=43658 RepID=A0A5S3WJ89_9GAMM|nr:hypothetical protein CWB99_19080 [Pseudoalteromonas rubra]TMP31087.1 hypothetical protein CWC00_14650 [Pseudoalteromonas rubra]